MKHRMNTEPEQTKPFDAEFDARLSRLHSELTQAKQLTTGGGTADDKQLRNAEDRLADIPKLKDLDQCVLAVHEVEAALCMLKPDDLLYPTWIRLRGNLYRFDRDRRDAWKDDISRLISPDGEILQNKTLRQRLQQLTLELQESAARYNRLAEERSTVTCSIYKLGLVLIAIIVVLLSICFAVSAMQITRPCLVLISLASSVLAGGMAAVFGRLTTIRAERTRYEFSTMFRWDMAARVCLGAVSALFVSAALLSGFFPIKVPDEATMRLAFLVVFGFAAGFSDRLFNQTLSKVIGARASRSSTSSD